MMKGGVPTYRELLHGHLMLSVFGAFAEANPSLIRERTKGKVFGHG